MDEKLNSGKEGSGFFATRSPYEDVHQKDGVPFENKYDPEANPKLPKKSAPPKLEWSDFWEGREPTFRKEDKT